MSQLRVSVALVLLFSGLTLAQFQPVDVQKIGPQTGQKAPAFELPDQTGMSRTLASVAGSKGTMLVFSRSAEWCPYCRSQMVEIQQNLEAIKAQGLGVAVITYDSVAILKAFADKYGITYPLLSDQGSAVIDRWGLRNQAATGRSAGIPHPGTFIIDPAATVTSRRFEQVYQERASTGSVLTSLGARPGRTTTVPGQQVTLDLSASDAVATVGHRLTLTVRVTPKPKHHVYAPGQVGYIPFTLKLASDPAFKVHAPRYPASTTYHFAPLKETVKVFSAPFTLQQDITLALTPDLRTRAERGETLTIRGTIESQACDDAVCYRPESIPVEWTVTLRSLIR